MLSIKPSDFDKTDGRKRIIFLIHILETKVYDLERTLKRLIGKEKKIDKAIEDIFNAEDGHFSK